MYIKTSWVNDQTELNAENMNHLEDGVEKAYGQLLLAVDSVAPEECVEGDKYYNTETNKIYTATGTNTWCTTGVDAELGVFYIVLESQNIYTYNGTTLISVGGGAGGGDSTPIGTIQEYAGSTAPNGYLMCDGSAVSRTTYKELFQVIGTAYGSGDGSTTFNLPNIKGKVVVMLDSNDTDFDTLGETGGNKEHKHLTALGFDNNYLYGYAGNDTNPAYGSEVVYNIKRNSLTGFSQTDNEPARLAQTDNASSLQPYIVLNKIIKVQKTAGEVLSEQLPVGTEVDFDGSASDIPIGWEQVNGVEYCVATTTTEQTITSNYSVNLNQIDRSNGNFTLYDGGIKIGAGIHHIRVSGAVFINGWPGGSNYLWGIIKKNNTYVSSSIVGSTASYLSASIASTIINVQENDVIKLIADSGAGGSTRTGSSNTWLLVEKVD